MRALTLSEKVAEMREEMLKEDSICPICGRYIEPDQAVLDHDHNTGRVRAVLHRTCNAGEGKMVQLFKRFFKDVNLANPSEVENLMYALHLHWSRDYSSMPFHPGHRFPEHKRIKALRKEIKSAKMLTTKIRKKEEIKLLQLKIKEKYG